MSERRNFPAESKDKKSAKVDHVGRGSVDSFGFLLDHITLKIDDNIRLVKNVPYALAGLGVVALLWRNNALRRLKGVAAVPQRVYRDNTRLPMRVVELNSDSIGLVHMPFIYRTVGLGQRYQADDVIHVRLSGVHFPRSVAELSSTVESEGDAPSEKLKHSGSSAPSPATGTVATDTEVAPREFSAPQPPPEDQAPGLTAGDTESVADISLPEYCHSEDCLAWMKENVDGRVLRMTLLKKGDRPFVFLYQRKFPNLLRPMFINLQLVKLGLAEAGPVSSPFLIKSDIRKLTSIMLQGERQAEKHRLGMWKETQPSFWERVRSFVWRRKL